MTSVYVWSWNPYSMKFMAALVISHWIFKKWEAQGFNIIIQENEGRGGGLLSDVYSHLLRFSAVNSRTDLKKAKHTCVFKSSCFRKNDVVSNGWQTATPYLLELVMRFQRGADICLEIPAFLFLQLFSFVTFDNSQTQIVSRHPYQYLAFSPRQQEIPKFFQRSFSFQS